MSAQLSFTGKRWDIQIDDSTRSLMDKVYEQKGLVDLSERKAYLEADPREQLHDPFLLHDMEKACIRIEQAIKDKERIVVFGDYDVDGVTATAVLVRTIKKLGGEVSYRIPHRINDGYSLKEYFLEELVEKDVKVLITVDNGIAAASEIAYANELGMDIIVTDHHTPPPADQLPVAHAIINPQLEACPYPCKDLSGSAVALKLCLALLSRNNNTDAHSKDFEDSLYQIAGIGIVADCMQLVGENRAIVQITLDLIKRKPLLGVKYLLQIANAADREVTAMGIGFVIGPRINAAGRLDSAYDALHLFLNQTESVKEVAQKLDHLNQQRRVITERFTEQAMVMVDEDKSFVFVSSPDWNSGINGLVASRLVEKHGKPVIVGSHKEGMVVASCRSVNGYNMVDALRAHEDLLEHFGGHAMAAGFSIKEEHLVEFKQRMHVYTSQTLHTTDTTRSLEVTCDIVAEDFSMDQLVELSRLEPYGLGNPKPRFIIRNVELQVPKPVGQDKSHMSCSILGVKAIAFRQAQYLPEATGPLDIVLTLDKNIWQGRESLQIMIEDMRPHAA